jgi:uncharacterized Tic20 family protein
VKYNRRPKPGSVDLQVLLTEYSVSKNLTYILMSLGLASIAVTVASVFGNLTRPNSFFGIISVFSFMFAFVFFVYAYYQEEKASKIANALEIKKCLKRYGIETE